jgi:DNA invertase Pin-like site-specific DNA recombinase
MLKRLNKDPEINGVIVHSLSRLGRSLGDIIHFVEDLQKQERVFISVKENFDMTTKEGRMLFGLMAVVNEYECELIMERMNEGRAYAESYGTKSGKPCHRPEKEINWGFVEACREENPPRSWNAIRKALRDWQGQNITTTTLIRRAKKRGMKID